MTLLAVSIAAEDTEAALAAMHQAADVADLAELRLDLMREFDLARLLDARPLPVIVTCRPPREGGRWQGDEDTRLKVLHNAASLGAEFVDLEWDAAHCLPTLDRTHTRVILSHHDFAGMPASPAEQARRMRSTGADAVKVVGTAGLLADALPALELLDSAGGPTIAIAMGACGLATRLLAFCYPKALLSFAASDTGSQTAAGQIGARVMDEIYRVRRIGPSTRLVGWLAADANEAGEAAAANRWLAAQDMDARVVPLQHAPGEATDETLKRLAQLAPVAACVRPAGSELQVWTAARPRWSHTSEPLTGVLGPILMARMETEHGA